MATNLNFIQGKKIEIKTILLQSMKSQFDVLIDAVVDNVCFTLNFRNVSNLSFHELFAPLEIYGFEYHDNKQKGWDKSIRYSIRDFEDDKLRFDCESIDCIVNQKH